MAVESIGSVLGSQQASLERSGLGQEAFLRILLTQLTFQDPLKPLDNEAFVAQLAQFSSLEQSRQSNENSELLLQLETVSQSLGLLGRTVQVGTDTGAQVGRVTTVSFDESGTPRLSIATDIGGFLTDVGLSQVAIISQTSGE